MQIGAQMRRTTIPHLNPIFEHLKMQIEMKWYISQSVQQLWQISTLKHNLRWETGLLSTSRVAVAERVVVNGAGGIGVQAAEALEATARDNSLTLGDLLKTRSAPDAEVTGCTLYTSLFVLMKSAEIRC